MRRGYSNHLRRGVDKQLASTQTAIRVVVTEMTRTGWNLEVGVLAGANKPGLSSTGLFRLRKRKVSNTDEFNAVLLIPTGVGAELGGHSGDGGALAVAMASLCDNLITHPNVVNASDINELPPNGLYVEGSLICRLLMGTVGTSEGPVEQGSCCLGGSSGSHDCGALYQCRFCSTCGNGL